MSCISLIIKVGEANATLLSEALLEHGALSIDIHDAAAGTEREQLLFGEPGEAVDEIWKNAEVTALFEKSTDITSVILAIEHSTQISIQLNYRLEEIEEQDWVRVTQSQFNPIQISSRLWIVPTWHQSPDPTAINLILDPGLAFGTGSHPTTQLCLTWLDQQLQQGENVLDYGCGSGILAIAALKLGASHVTGIDIDPNALEASHMNAACNHCNLSNIKFATAYDGLNGNTPVDIVVANILANPLMILAPILMNACRSGGRIVLSGILHEQAEEVMTVYQQCFTMQISGEQHGWVLLTGRKNNSRTN